jgi:hypothetical protein
VVDRPGRTAGEEDEETEDAEEPAGLDHDIKSDQPT